MKRIFGYPWWQVAIVWVAGATFLRTILIKFVLTPHFLDFLNPDSVSFELTAATKAVYVLGFIASPWGVWHPKAIVLIVPIFVAALLADPIARKANVPEGLGKIGFNLIYLVIMIQVIRYLWGLWFAR